MCIVFFSYKSHPRYWLIAAFNRDEFFSRETKPAHHWPNSDIFAGQDAVRGGTWFGVSTKGRFAWLTNFRSGKGPVSGAKSRGDLVTNFLSNDVNASGYLQQINRDAQQYGGCNVVVGSREELYYYSNVTGKSQKLSCGVYGLCNHLLDTPWPKLRRGKKTFAGIIAEEQDHTKMHERLLPLMRDRRHASIFKLPKTGVSKYFEWHLSSIFVEMRGYGTRSTSILFIDNHNQMNYYEHSYAQKEIKSVHFSKKM